MKNRSNGAVEKESRYGSDGMIAFVAVLWNVRAVHPNPHRNRNVLWNELTQLLLGELLESCKRLLFPQTIRHFNDKYLPFYGTY